MSRITLDIVVDSKGNVTAVKQAGKDVGDLGDKSEKTSGQMDGLKKAAAFVGSAFAALKTAEAVVDFVKLGAQVEATEHRFEQFAGGPAQATEYLEAFQEATDNTVDRMSSMQGAAKLLQMGLVDSADEMSAVAGIATKLGDQTMSAGDRIADFAALLANQSIPRLDNFGISSGRVRTRIDELLKSGQALNREQAFKMAVMEEGAKSMAILGDTSDLTANQIAQLESSFADAKNGVALLSAEMLEFGGVGDWLSTRLRDFPDTLRQIAYMSIASGAAMNEFKFSLMSFQNPLQAAVDASNMFKQSLYDLVDPGDHVSEVLRYQHQVTKSLEDQIRDITTANVAYGESLDSIQERELDAGRAGFEMRQVLDNAGTSIEALIEAEMTMGNQFTLSTGSIEAQKRAMEEVEAATRAHELASIDLAAQLMDASAAQIANAAITDLKAALDAGTITHDQYRAAVMDVQLQFGLATMESIGMAEGVLGLTEQLASGKISAGQYAQELARVTGQVDGSTSAVENYKRALDALPREITIRIRQELQKATVADPTRLGGETKAAGGWTRGGMTLVGEQGAELVQMPRGAYVYTAEETRRLMEMAEMYGSAQGAPNFGGPAPMPLGENDWYMTDWRTNSGRSASIRQQGGAPVVINNYFGAGSVRSDEDIEAIADRMAGIFELRGVRTWT